MGLISLTRFHSVTIHLIRRIFCRVYNFVNLCSLQPSLTKHGRVRVLSNITLSLRPNTAAGSELGWGGRVELYPVTPGLRKPCSFPSYLKAPMTESNWPSLGSGGWALLLMLCSQNMLISDKMTSTLLDSCSESLSSPHSKAKPLAIYQKPHCCIALRHMSSAIYFRLLGFFVC